MCADYYRYTECSEILYNVYGMTVLAQTDRNYTYISAALFPITFIRAHFIVDTSSIVFNSSHLGPCCSYRCCCLHPDIFRAILLVLICFVFMCVCVHGHYKKVHCLAALDVRPPDLFGYKNKSSRNGDVYDCKVPVAIHNRLGYTDSNSQDMWTSINTFAPAAIIHTYVHVTNARYLFLDPSHVCVYVCAGTNMCETFKSIIMNFPLKTF